MWFSFEPLTTLTSMSPFSKNTFIAVANLLAIITLIIVLSIHFFSTKNETTIVHIDNAKVFSQFNLSKELSAIGMQQINPQKQKVDSLVSKFQQEDNLKSKEELQRIFLAENDKLKKMNDEISNQTNYQIWSRINQYAKDYGQEHQYEMILGTTGNGNLMYAETTLDVTDDFIAYANKKYEGE